MPSCIGHVYSIVHPLCTHCAAIMMTVAPTDTGIVWGIETETDILSKGTLSFKQNLCDILFLKLMTAC